jgi:hypothetical protein
MQNKKILIAILARDKEATLPLYLECIEKLDYPKRDIILYIRTNNNSDNTKGLLLNFISKNVREYNRIMFNSDDIDKNLTTHHEWNAERFSVLGKIRQDSLGEALKSDCDYYFVVDCDNFILPHTLKSLLKFNVPIISPMLVSDQSNYYSNFHYEVDDNGYLAPDNKYYDIFARGIKGAIQVKVVHCTYLVKVEYIDKLVYDDGSGRYEYVIFSDSARKNNIPQYIDNTEMYGLITFKTKPEEMVDVNFDNFSNKIKSYIAFQND